ncbi:hypothetical protein CLOP_g14668, partial [Closterium sp. NIES-67]
LPSGLPSERPQDHKIELEPGAQPTVRTQWRLTQPELHELRNQLDYLLAKGLIRPSTSPFAAPILFTPNKDADFACQAVFEALKTLLMSPSVLRIADPERPFEVITDASDNAIEAVLMQDFGNGLQPIVYESKKMQY